MVAMRQATSQTIALLLPIALLTLTCLVIDGFQVSCVPPVCSSTTTSTRCTLRTRQGTQRMTTTTTTRIFLSQSSSDNEVHRQRKESKVDSQKKWRLCAAAAILNSSSDQLLLGKRVNFDSVWQCPQGGLEDQHQETVQEAAVRELYEEMGLVVGQHVELLADELPPVRYTSRGTDAWMERAGFQGQELHWVLFRWIDTDCEMNPDRVCDLKGLNGETAEFSAVAWSTVEEMLENVQDKKRNAYEVLAKVLRAKRGEDQDDLLDNDDNARSQFGTREYWNSVYIGQGDFPMDEYSWYYGWNTIKPFWLSAVPDKNSNVLLPGIGNDSILLDLFGSGYQTLTAFDYSHHAIERQRDLLSFEQKALDSVDLRQMDARSLDSSWTKKFDAILEKGALDAIYLSGDGNVERAVNEIRRVLRPGGILVSVSGVVPEELRRELFVDWEWLRDGKEDLQAGCFILRLKA